MTSPMDFSQTPAQELHAMCLAGDDSAWGYVHGYVLSVSRWPKWGLGDRAEDLAQDVVMKLMNGGLEKVRQPVAFRGFLKKVTVNQILDHLRKKTPPTRSLGEPVMPGNPDSPPFEIPSDCPTAEEETSEKQMYAAVARALLDLPEYCRRVLPHYFRYRLGLVESYQELSRLLGSSVGTISAQVHRCLALLAEVPEIAAFRRGA